MTGVRDIAGSERGVFCVALVLIATALVVIGKLSGAEWVAMVQWTVTAFVAGKTYTGVVERKTGTSPTTPVQ